MDTIFPGENATPQFKVIRSVGVVVTTKRLVVVQWCYTVVLMLHLTQQQMGFILACHQVSPGIHVNK